MKKKRETRQPQSSFSRDVELGEGETEQTIRALGREHLAWNWVGNVFTWKSWGHHGFYEADSKRRRETRGREVV